MPIIKVTDPYQVNGALTSKWVAIFSGGGVQWKFKRTDFIVTSTSNASGNTKLNIAAAGVPTLSVGGYVYVMLASGVAGIYTILANTASDITIDLAWTSSTTGYVNLTTDYSNYKISVDYQYSTDGGSTWIDLSVDNPYYPGPDQTFIVNATPFVKSLVKLTNTAINQSAVNDIAIDADAYCRLVLTVEADGPSGAISASAIANQEIRISISAHQQQNAKGVNQLNYITDNVPTQALNFLSDFVQPTYFNGYPFQLYFIFSELMTGLTFDSREREVVGTTVNSTNTYIVDQTKIKHINRLNLHGGYSSGTEKIYIDLKNHSSSTLYSETKIVKYSPCTYQNPVFLKWTGPSGAWNYWLFGTKQDEGLNTSARQGEFSKTITDLSTHDSDSDFISKESNPTLKLYAENLIANDIVGLATLLESVKVMMLINPTTWVSDGVDKWQTVRIAPGNYNLGDNFSYLRSFECTIELPQIYLQTN